MEILNLGHLIYFLLRSGALYKSKIAAQQGRGGQGLNEIKTNNVTYMLHVVYYCHRFRLCAVLC